MKTFQSALQKLGAATGATLLTTTVAMAQTSSVQLYGAIDLAVGQVAAQPPGPPNAAIASTRGVHNGGVQTSYFGIRGAEDLGDGLKAKFTLESFLRADTGEYGRFSPPAAPAQDPFFSREAWVGLEGGFGAIHLGANVNPAFLAMIFTSAMGDNSLFSPSFRQQYNGSTRGYMALDTTMQNSIAYSTPRLGGVVGMITVMANEGSGSGANYAGNLVYRGGPLLLAASATKVRHSPGSDAAKDQQTVMVGGSYDLKVLRLFAQYTDFNDKLADLKVKTPHIGLTMPMGAGELQLAWARGKSSGSNTEARTTSSLGYYHNISRRTGLYGILSTDKLAVGTANSYVVGIRHTF